MLLRARSGEREGGGGVAKLIEGILERARRATGRKLPLLVHARTLAGIGLPARLEFQRIDKFPNDCYILVVFLLVLPITILRL